MHNPEIIRGTIIETYLSDFKEEIYSLISEEKQIGEYSQKYFSKSIIRLRLINHLYLSARKRGHEKLGSAEQLCGSIHIHVSCVNFKF